MCLHLVPDSSTPLPAYPILAALKRLLPTGADIPALLALLRQKNCAADSAMHSLCELFGTEADMASAGAQQLLDAVVAAVRELLAEQPGRVRAAGATPMAPASGGAADQPRLQLRAQAQPAVAWTAPFAGPPVR